MTEPERMLRFHTETAGRQILPAEPFAAGWRRVAADLAADTVAQLRQNDDGIDERVHLARKNLKRMRAMLRLVRPALDPADFTTVNLMLRDTGRSLATARDARVLLGTVAGLIDRYGDLLGVDAFAAASRRFSARHRTAVASLPENAERAAAEVVEAAGRIRSLRSLPEGFPAVGAGMGRVYRAARRAMGRAELTGDPAAFHEWRKRVKDLRHQMELLQPMQPVLLGAMAQELDRLGELLGVDHDLVVLAEAVRSDPASGRSDRERWLMLALAHEWRAELQATLLPLGAAVHAERRRAFVARMEGYWEAGRSR